MKRFELKKIIISVMKEAKDYDLMYAHLGNGISIADRNREEYGDYKKVAHISAQRKVTYYDKKLPTKIKQKIEKYAKTANPSVSTSQPEKKVFEEIFFEDWKQKWGKTQVAKVILRNRKEDEKFGGSARITIGRRGSTAVWKGDKGISMSFLATSNKWKPFQMKGITSKTIITDEEAVSFIKQVLGVK